MHRLTTMNPSEGTPSTGAVFARALELYRQGAFTQSDATLDRLLELDPRHFDALHLQGVIASRLAQPARAAKLIRRAIDQSPRIAAAHRHLGNAWRDLGRFEEAVASYDRAIELRADFKEAYVNRAMTLLILRRAAEALADLERAMSLGADDAHVHLLRGSALIDLGRPADAVASCDRAIAQQPAQPDAYVNKAAALYRLGFYPDAVSNCDRAIDLLANHAEAHAYRGAALYAIRRLDDALASLESAIGLKPDSALAHNVRALCLLDLGRAPQALASAEQAIALRADLADAHNSRGLALADARRFDEAVASFDRAIELKPEVREPHFNKGVRYLQQGDFERGWELYEKRPLFDRAMSLPGTCLWDGGADVAGKTVFTYAEQGLGDTLQFCRYAKLLSARGARVVLAVQQGLRYLLRGLGAEIEIVGLDHVPRDFDFHCPLLSLPRAFATRLDSIPADVPYLGTDPSRVAKWRERLGMYGRPIGIRWQGSTGRADAGRSFPLHYFESIACIPEVRLVSLQRGAGSEQRVELPPSWHVEDLGTDFEPGGTDAFLDVAALMQCLDLVVTSDTSIAHLAGALGRPAWVALKHIPDWRWMLDREDSPWYPTLRLFRQNRPGDWAGVFERMRNELELDRSEPPPRELPE